MSLMLDKVKEALSVTKPATEVDAATMKKIERARARHKQWCPGWAETLAFVEGRQFVFRSKAANTTTLNELDTSPGGAKPNYRARTVRNRVLDFWLSEVSAGTQRVPQYEVTPTSTDPEIMAAAKLAEKVLMYLYDFLELRQNLVEAYGYGVACGEGFIRPYWYAQGGNQLPPPPDPNPDDPEEMAEYDPQEDLYEGDLCLDALGPDQVMWEPGSSFEDSPYHIIEQAQTIDYVKGLPGFTGVELKPDVQGHASFVAGQLNKSAARGDMVLTTEWLEKPSEKNPTGTRFLIANGQKVVPDEAYPLVAKGPKGYEPCIHRMSYIRTPWRDRDMGLVEHLLDPARTLNDCENKGIEWKNLALLPQMLAPRGAKVDRPTTEPGALIRYEGTVAPTWRTVPPIPESLFELRRNAIEDMEAIASQRTPPGGVDSGKGMATFIESDARRGQMQIQALADFHSKLGRHLLLWVQQRYTEERLLSIVGRPGMSASYVPFKGADLRDQTQVRVLPGSIEPLTRAAVEQKVMNLAQLGWISKEEGIAAINNGTAENLVQDYELDVAKQGRENQQMNAIGDPNLPGGGVPDAAPFDNHQVHLDVLHREMKTREWEEQPPPVQEAYRLHEEQHQVLQDQADAKAMQQQNLQAEQLGLSNAAKPQNQAKPLPSLPSVNGKQ